MATGSLYGSVSESTGLYGIGAASGGTYFEWFIFYDSATAPSTPTGGTWSFTTNTGTAPTGWLNAPPATPVNQVWVSIAVVDSRNTSTLSWSLPGLMTGAGLPILSGSGVPSSGAGLNSQLYINTATTPQSMYFKESGAWVQITGTNLVDLVSNQTIDGIKTFSQTIIGNISGSAASVSGVVAIANGGTNATTTSGARSNLGLGTIAVQDASTVAITGGTITGITDLAVADGGTGASTAANARTNLGAVGLTDTQTLTNKSISGSTNTLTNIGNSSLTNSSVTVNGSAIALGSSGTVTANTPNNLVFGNGLSANANFNGSQQVNVALTAVGNAGVYGTSNVIPVITTNSTGQITNVESQTITVNSANISGTVAVLQGGTGASNVTNARINLLPSYTSNNGKLLAINALGTDLEWKAISGVGTVTSVDVSGGTTGLTTYGGPITAAGTVTLAGTLNVANGGTGVTTSTGTGSVVLNTAPTFASYVNYTPIAAPTYLEGRLFYDSTAHTLNYYNDNSQMSVNIGQENVIRVRNQTGATIPEGSVVYINGATGNTPTISLAIATAFATADIIGVATTTIADNGFGYATTSGLVNDLDLSLFTEGQAVFVSPTTAGAFTATEPVAPNYSVQVGVVLRANPSNGTLLVAVQMISTEVSHIIGTVLATQGGTGQTSYSVGDLLYASTTTALSKLADVATGNALISGGVGTAPSYGKIGLTSHVSGTLPTANGGTGLTSFTANGVVYASSTSALATGSALTFDGTSLSLANGGTVKIYDQNSITFGVFNNGSSGTLLQGGTSTSFLTYVNGLLRQEITNTGVSIWSVAGSEQMRLTSTGLGIGTSSPAAKLHVYGSGQIGIIESSGNYTTTGSGYLRWKDVNGNAAFVGFGGNANNFDIFNALAGSITFSTNSSVKATLDSAGNLGLGVTPSAWNSVYRAVQLPFGASLTGRTDTPETMLASNTYRDGSGFKYFGAGSATSYFQTSGSHLWLIAGAGTAGDAISFTQAMTLDASGRLGIGNTNPSSKLDISIASSGTFQNAISASNSVDSDFVIRIKTGISDINNSAGVLTFSTSGSERARIDSAGALKLVTSDSRFLGGDATGRLIVSNSDTTSYLGFYGSSHATLPYALSFVANGNTMTLNSAGNLGLGVTPSAWVDDKAIVVNYGAISSGYEYGASFSANAYRVASNAWKYQVAANVAASRYNQSGGVHAWYNAPSGTAGAAITFTQAMTLDAGGDLYLPSNFYIGDSGHTTSKISSGSGSAPLIFGINGAEKARIDSAGNLLVGTTTSSGRITAALGGGHVFNAELNGTLVGSTNGVLLSNFLNQTTRVAAINLSATDSNAGAIIFGTASGGTLAERARIDAAGNLLIGQTSVGVQNTNGFSLNPTGASLSQNHLNGTASGTVYTYFGYNGSIIGSVSQTGTTGVLYNVTSDQRLKENIVDAPEFGSVIDSIQVRSYDWKTDQTHQRAGFIAQELVNVAPEAVHQPADPEAMMAVDYSKLVPMLVKEIQDLRKRLAALEAA